MIVTDAFICVNQPQWVNPSLVPQELLSSEIECCDYLLGAVSIQRCCFISIRILIMKKRWSCDHLIFMRRNALSEKMVFVLKLGPGFISICETWTLFYNCIWGVGPISTFPGNFLKMGLANEGRPCNVTSSLIGWTHTPNDPCCSEINLPHIFLGYASLWCLFV